MLYTSSGLLHYEDKKLIVSADQELSRYYRALVPTYIRLNPQRYPAHISVVRNETPSLMEHWGKHQGREIEFQYEPYVHSGTIYYWLNVFSSELEGIRSE